MPTHSRNVLPRSTVLHRYEILDTPPEDRYDRPVQLAADLFDAPMALLSFLDGDRAWIKARQNFDHSELSRKAAFCPVAIDTGEAFAVEDAPADPRFSTHPLVTATPNVRFVAGAPLTPPDAPPIGALTVLAPDSRTPSSSLLESLQHLADLVVEALERRRSHPHDEENLSSPAPPTDQEDRLHASLLQSAVEQANEAIVITEGAPLDAPGPRITYVNPGFTEITGYEPAEVIGKTPRFLQGPATESWVLDRLRHRLEQGKPFLGEAINYRKDGTPYVNQWSIAPIRNSDDVITHWVSVQRDVSEQRHMSEQLLQAQEKERSRLARTMHDELGGQLTTLQLLVNRINSHVPDAQQSVSSLLGELATHIDTLSSTVRYLTGSFSSQVLGDFGLSVAVDRLVEKLKNEENLTITLHNEISQDERLSPILEHVLFRILRTTLATVVRHSDAETARVLFSKTEHELCLQVIDHGTGFAFSSAPHEERNYGFSAMMEHVNRLNGTLSINTDPEGDTRLTVTLPLFLLSLPQSAEQRSS